MLHAVEHGKKRGTTLEGKRLLFGEFEGAEDVLTSCVFGRLRYVDDATLWSLLRRLPGFPQEPSDAGALENIEFWPRMPHPKGGGVEPDVLIRFRSIVVAVEAKRSDYVGTQDAGQLKREVEVLRHQGEERPIVIVALGGRQLSEDSRGALISGDYGEKATPVLSTWTALFEAIEATLLESNSESGARLLDDIRLSYALLGLLKPEVRYFSTLNAVNIDLHLCPRLASS